MGSAVHVEGLTSLLRALRRAETGADRELKGRLRKMAEPIRDRARANVEHKTGRHGDPDLPPLADTIKIGVTQKAVSVYSASPYSARQDRGGYGNHGSLITRANASAYMTRAVEQGQANIADEVENLWEDMEIEIARDW